MCLRNRALLFVVMAFACLVAVPVLADSVNTKERTVTKLAEGVYAIRHPDALDGFPQGNTTVIIGDREVLVVDSCYLPSSAREDIAQIRQWTSKPVRYLLNTHWHFDHTMGNAAYLDAFPSLTIVAHSETAKQIAGYNPGWFEHYPQRATRFQKRLDSGKDQLGKPLTDVDKNELKTAIAGVKPTEEEFKPLESRLHDMTPSLTFEQEIDFDLGNREVQVQYLGRGNTLGDAIVYLPKERILVTGDLLDHPVPYLGGGYPVEEIGTLERLARLDAQIIVPGHGDVLHDKVYLNQVIDFVKAVTAQASKAVYQSVNRGNALEEVQQFVEKNIDLDAWRQKFAGDSKDDRDFFDSFAFPGLVKAAYNETWPR